MSDKELDDLRRRMSAVENNLGTKPWNAAIQADLPQKLDKSAFDKYTSDQEKEQNSIFSLGAMDVLKVAVISKAVNFIKLEIPAIFDSAALGEKLLSRMRIERNQWGFLWRRSGAPDPVTQLKTTMDRIYPVVVRLNTQYPAAKAAQIDRKLSAITGAYRRIAILEKDVARLDRSAATARDRVRSTVPPAQRATIGNTNSFTETAQQINRLEERITMLAAAIG